MSDVAVHEPQVHGTSMHNGGDSQAWVTGRDGLAQQLGRAPLTDPSLSLNDVTTIIAQPIERKTNLRWLIGLAISGLVALFGLYCMGRVVYYGPGEWGLNNTVNWAWDITNFVWWVGIGHAGTLISAVLLLFRQRWRMSIARFSEAMTIFAVLCAGLFPLLHTGRQWKAAYWLFPYPNQMHMWTQFRSPLEWDVFAVSTYLTVSAVFWFVGMVPDLAVLRDRYAVKINGPNPRPTDYVAYYGYGLASLGWRGSNRQWQHWEMASLLLAALATPLVLSVHTIVSFDFATSLEPGWHTTIFPPYFVAGAIFSGFAMVVTLTVLARFFYPEIGRVMTMQHLERMNKIIMTTGLIVGLAYGTEFFIAWYSGNPFERYVFLNRAMGPYAWAYWSMIICNVLLPQVFWTKWARTSIPMMFIISITTNIGMWFERFVIIATSLHRDFLPSSWSYFHPSWVDVGVYVGTLGIFGTLFLLFCRYIPMVSLAEAKAIMVGAQPHHGDPHGAHGHNGHGVHHGSALTQGEHGAVSVMTTETSEPTASERPRTGNGEAR